MKYKQIEFIRTNCLMRKGYRYYIDSLDSLDPSDRVDLDDFVWNFHIDKENLEEYLDILMECLTEDEKKIVIAKFFEDKTFREIKKDFTVSHQMIHKRFHNALKKLRKYAKRLEAYNKLDL